MSSGFSRMDFFRLLELENGDLTVTYTTFVGLLGHKPSMMMMMNVSNRLDNDNRLDDDNRLVDDEERGSTFSTARSSRTSR